MPTFIIKLRLLHKKIVEEKMKKFKSLLLVCMAALLAFAIPFAACETTPDNGDTPPIETPTITTELLSINVNTDNVKKEYYKGDYFTSNGLVVTATTKRSDRENSQTSTITNRAIIDSTAFRRNRVGSYDILISYTLGETTKTASYTVHVNDIELELNTSQVKKVFLMNQDEFNSDGLTATATTIKPGAENISKDVTNAITLDSSKFDNTKVGTYPITATYVEGLVTRTSMYEVEVMEPREGLQVTLADGAIAAEDLQEGTTDTIALSTAKPTSGFNPSNITVKTVDAYGNVSAQPLSSSEYTLKVYKEDTEITSYSNLGAGTYQIWAYKKAPIAQDYEMSGFALIYIVDNLKTFEFTGGVTSQEIGIDEMSSGWTYKATYETGKEVNLTAENVVVSNLSTLTQTGTSSNPDATRTAYASFTDVNAKGEKITKTVNIPYTVVQGNKIRNVNNYDYSKIPVKDKDNTPLTQADFADVANSFITLAGGTVNYRTGNACIEIRYDALQVTFTGVGTLVIEARSTGNSNVSSIGVKGADGKYVAGTFSSSDVTELTYPNGKAYQVTGGYNAITFTISKPGTYTIFTLTDDPEGSSTYNRTTRINAITKTDIYANQG